MSVEMDGGGRWQRLQPRERMLIIIVGIVALLGIVYLLFLSGGGEEEIEGFPTTPTRPTTTAAPSATPTASPAVPETFEVFEGKDPFRPLVVTGGEDGGGTTGGTTGGATTGGTTGGPSSGGTRDSQRVTLVDISGSGSDRTATVEVDSTEYEVKEGETFAGSYLVKDLQASCGTFVFADESFTLCVGQEVLK
ncbi:MAG: hypothetical protein WAT66_09775 [Actinomycetota bacterium]